MMLSLKSCYADSLYHHWADRWAFSIRRVKPVFSIALLDVDPSSGGSRPNHLAISIEIGSQCRLDTVQLSLRFQNYRKPLSHKLSFRVVTSTCKLAEW